MASNIYHPLPAFYFILVAVIWCSASVTRRFADRSYFALSLIHISEPTRH